MRVCQQCNNEQQSGNFCGQCGGTLIEGEKAYSGSERTADGETESEQAHQESAATVDAEQSTRMEQNKKALESYMTFVVNHLKNPTRALKLNESKFVYGLITMVLFSFAYALSIYFLANKIVKEMFGRMASSLPFIDLTFPLLFFIILFVAGASISIVAAVKLMNDSSSIKLIISQFGGLLVPFAVVNVATLIFALAGATKFTIVITSLSLIFAIILLPMLLAFEKGSKQSGPDNQKVYFSLGTAGLSMLISYIIIRLAVADFLDKFDHVLYWF